MANKPHEGIDAAGRGADPDDPPRRTLRRVCAHSLTLRPSRKSGCRELEAQERVAQDA
jgi:hypothetical protein